MNEKRILATMFGSTLNSSNKTGQYVYDWSELKDKLMNPLRNDSLTVSEFIDKKKPIWVKSAAGYYIMGACGLDQHGLPSRASQVQPPKEFGLVSIDGDGVAADWDEKVKQVLSGYEYVIHATISSHRGDIRRRLVIPLAQNVDCDTREALIRLLVAEIGTQGIDKTCIEAKRAMCFPVVLNGGDEFTFHNEGKFLDAVEWLNSTGKAWHDMENLPLFDGERQIKNRIQSYCKANRIEETGEWTPPTGLGNAWINAYCSTYRVSDVLDDYRPGYYTQVRPGRYNHGEASGCTGGIQVINDAHLYSWYATDKLSNGKLMNAYEVMVILTGQTEKNALKNIMGDPKVQETMREQHLKNLNVPECAKDWSSKYDVTDEGLARRCMECYSSKRRDGSWWDYKPSEGIYRKVSDETMLDKVSKVCRMVLALQQSEEIEKYVGKTNKLKAVLTYWQGLADAVAPAEDDWDNKPTYLCLEDCIIDLPTFCSTACEWTSVEGVKAAVVGFKPEFLLTKKIHLPLSALFTPECASARIELSKAMTLYLPDVMVQTYFWRCLGSCLDGRSYADNRVIWLNGPHAGNGKSTIMSAITAALGNDADGYSGISEVALFYKKRDDDNGEGANPKLESLRNTRLAHFAEGDKKRTINTSKIKNFTGGQKVFTRALYKGGSAWLPRMRMVFDSNGMPSLDGPDDGFFRRLRIIPFRQKIRDVVGEDTSVITRWQQDKRIHAAILFMMLTGLNDWYQHGRKTDNGLDDCPTDVQVETESYINSFDDIRQYFEDCLEATGLDTDFAPKSDVYNDYCQQCSGKQAARHTFLMALEEWCNENGLELTKRKKNCVMKPGYIGLKILSEDAMPTRGWNY